MDRKTNYPDSDESARSIHPGMDDRDTTETSDQHENLQTSVKSGKHSTVEKLSASRPEFGTGRGAIPVDGAFGSAGRRKQRREAGDKGQSGRGIQATSRRAPIAGSTRMSPWLSPVAASQLSQL